MKKTLSFALTAILCFSLITPASASQSGLSKVQNVVCADYRTSAVIMADGSLYIWGGYNGEIPYPEKVMDNTWSIYCSDNEYAAIKTDNSLWCGRFGQTSYNSYPYIDDPAKVADNVLSFQSDCYLTTDGKLYRLKNESSGSYKSFYITDNVTAASINLYTAWGRGCKLVVRPDSSLWMSGFGYYGDGKDCVDGNGTDSNDLIKIMDDIKYVSCYGGPHSYDMMYAVIKNDNTLWTWGENSYGQLGNGSKEKSLVPVKILDDVVAVDCGCDDLSCTIGALKSDGTLWMWGDNSYYNIGNGRGGRNESDTGVECQLTPVKVLDDVVAFSCGACHTLAVRSDGSLWGWGCNLNNELGNGGKGDLLTKYYNLDIYYQTVPIKLMDGVMVPGAGKTPSSWAAEEVNAAIAVGLVPEQLQQNYKYPVSRGQVAQLFVELLEKAGGKSIDALLAEKGDSVNSDAFTDTNDSAVLACRALGIINGVGNNRFDPDGTLTRAQLAAILNREAHILGVNTEGYTHCFADVSGHWVNTELGWPAYAGIINGVGDNRFDPDSPVTTEQAILITYRALQKLK